jgi:uncharacterized phage protein (TIGR01671 family)
MRTIKFRGKASHDGEWLYGDLINIYGDYHILGEDDMREDGHHITQDSDRPTWVEPDTIGQFTGLLDKNGKEIYEGDILQYRKSIFSVSYEYSHLGSFSLVQEGFFAGRFGDLTEPFYCEVIGNIHDNPELLEGGEK